MNNVPQIGRRRIGSVIIIDLKGELVGPWAMRAKENIETLIENSKTDKILINLRDVTTIDSLGVKAIVENVPHTAKSGIVSGRISVMEMVSLLADLSDVHVFKNEDDVVSYYAHEFVANNNFSPMPEEQRKHERLKTALPLEFWYEDAAGEKVTFAAIITDLSEGGVFCEYLDVDSLEEFNRAFQLNDLKELHMRVKLPELEHIFVSGVVTRTVLGSEQVGIAVMFTDLKDEDRQAINSFLSS